jgi:NAD-dependent dihydropyrimidine dehydrogenase PreA subunit
MDQASQLAGDLKEIRMTIKSIDYAKCTNCGTCYDTCPMDVFIKKEKVYIKYRKDCMSCYLCEMDCPAGAIYVSPERPGGAVFPW